MEKILNAFEGYLRGEKDVSPATIRSYLSDLKKFMRWYFETTGDPVRVDAVGPLDIAEFKRYMLNQNRKPATINRALASLSTFFTWAVGQGHAAQNPVSGVKPVRETRSAPRALGRREQLALMRAVQKSGRVRDIALVTLLLHTGLRVSEVCALTLEDITLRERSGVVVVRSGKGSKRREVPLNATARKALKNWLAVRGEAPGPL
ncbi:tyrosine-type recombinase/integrase, partial [Calderihabitans maritimus]|uniref:tyrosine-type recombinase/integrase n=1 Tax=Calderihabitans maritimus TaxID=1246530 RepID=UPI000B509C0D